MKLSVSELTAERISELLAARQADPYISPMRESFFNQEPKPAAVLVPLLQRESEWHLVFILRSVVEGDMHSGQVAYPGGRWDPGETDAEQAALREANEETGLPPEGVRILGRLEDFITISNYRVTPIVATIPSADGLRPQEGEVQRIFTIPLSYLADPANREERERVAPSGETLKVVYFKEYDKELLWGVTARITLNFLQALKLV